MIDENLILLLPMLIALYHDIRHGIIPNRLIVLGSCLGLAVEYAATGWEGAVRGALSCIVTIAILFVLFVTRAMGAGDIKLYSLISIYMGVKNALIVFIISIFLAGIYIIISTIIHFNSINVVQVLATTVSNFVMTGNVKKKPNFKKDSFVELHTVKMTPYILTGFVIVAFL